MALTPGTRVGVYEVTAQIGEGGMGQVYRARDTKLDRDVAIKILPEAFAHDAGPIDFTERGDPGVGKYVRWKVNATVDGFTKELVDFAWK